MVTKYVFAFRLVQRALFVASLIAISLLLSNGATKAAMLGPGDLDPTFGDGGKIVGLGMNGLSAVVVQPDGKILLAGTFASWISMEFAVTRLLPDGTPDATFGPGFYGVPGQVETDFTGLDDYASSLVLLSDGTIVAGGAADCSGQDDCRFGLAWYSPDGRELGNLTTSFSTSAGVNSLALQNGKIVAAGGRYLARYARLAPDNSFLLEGTVTTNMTEILTVVVQPDGTPEGRLVAAGWCRNDVGTYFSCMARFGADGSLDSTFGTDGWVADLGQTVFSALTLQPDRKLVVAGNGGSGDFVLARYNSDGSLDSTFGTDGQVSTDFGNADHASAIAIQPDGKIIAAGTTATPALQVSQFALARYHAGGSLDYTFGTLGKVTTGFGDANYTEWEATAVTVQPDGKIIAGGLGRWPGIVGGLLPAVARYLGGDLAPISAPSNLVATAVSDSQIDLTWVDNSDREDRFDIERCTGTSAQCAANPDFSPIASVGANVTSFSNTGLSANTTFSYRVRAVNNSGGASPYSNVNDAMTNAAPVAAPSDLSATAVSSNQINLTWSDNSNESRFDIERCTGTPAVCGANPPAFASIASVDANVTSYSSGGLSSDTTYSYRVRAVTSQGDISAYSNVAEARTLTVPAVPTDLRAVAGKKATTVWVTLTWTDNSTNETGFKIERRITGGTFTQISVSSAGVTSYRDNAVVRKNTYEYRVRATSPAGDSGYSDIVSVKTN